MTFPAWLYHHRHDATPVGDLARDVLADPEFPRRTRATRSDLGRIRARLEAVGACDGAHRALRVALAAWLRHERTRHLGEP